MANIIDSIDGIDCIYYSGAKIKGSLIGNYCSVGEFSRVYESSFSDYVRIDRNNFIRNSYIGLCTYTGQFTTIMNCSIGNFCSISWGVTIGPGEHDYHRVTSHDFLYNPIYGIKPNTEIKEVYDRFEKPLHIGNDVWIGTNVSVLRGISIGDGAVVGANSVVVHDVPPYAIVAGCPARVIKYRFNEEQIKSLIDIAWWNLPINVIKDNFSVFSSIDIDLVIKGLMKIREKLL
ncbi:DapH/DapD/GlmU-related protein [Brenneria goodwinii]